jgi:hypothetical protein
MADANKTDPEVKKNDTASKNTPDSTTKSTDAKANTTMASSSTKPSTPTPVAKVTTPQTEVKYPIEDLIENSKTLTGHNKEVAVGALFGYKEKELTKADFKKAIDDFLKRKVK